MYWFKSQEDKITIDPQTFLQTDKAASFKLSNIKIFFKAHDDETYIMFSKNLKNEEEAAEIAKAKRGSCIELFEGFKKFFFVSSRPNNGMIYCRVKN